MIYFNNIYQNHNQKVIQNIKDIYSNKPYCYFHNK